MSIDIKSNEEKHKKLKEEEAVEDVKSKYMKRWNIKNPEKFHFKDTDSSIDFPKSLDDVGVGETWEDSRGTEWERVGKNTWTKVSHMQRYNPNMCFNEDCKRLLSNVNEINVNMVTGKCFKCHAKEEAEKIAKGEPFEEPEWRKNILIRDSFGNVLMDIQDYLEEYGDLNGYIFLTNLIDGMDEKRDDGKKVNEAMYNNANVILSQIRERREEDVELLEEIISEFKEEGIIKNRILDNEVQHLTKEFHKRKGNAKELELINSRKEKKDIRKLI